MEKLYDGKIFLASQSPRRAHLLSLIGLEYETKPAHIDEDAITELDPAKHVKALSLAKAEKIATDVESGLVIGADTIVVLDGEILGKPASHKEALEMLQKLSNQTHEVYTGFCLIEKPSGKIISDFEKTSIHFRNLADWEIENYVNTQSPMDKAGAYGIQDQSAVFADRIEGCFYNVVGFPLSKFYVTLLELLNKST